MVSPLPARRPTDLPIEELAGAVTAAARSGSLVLTAEPGAGKTSVVPLLVAEAMAAEAFAAGRNATGPDGGIGRVLVLQPRRLAARAAAERLNGLLATDQPLGHVVGLTMRAERQMSDGAAIEVMTEAVLTARLQRDPELPGVSAIIFDEFHERNLHSDLGLAMALEVRTTIRPDLCLVVMSATLDTQPVAALLETDNVIEMGGRMYPVETVHLTRPAASRWADAAADATGRALAETAGDVLVFVPGRREIDEVSRRLNGESVEVIGLHGGSGAETRRQVLRRGGRRRVIVATSVAETSLTLPGIGAVVDGGLARRARFDPATGLGRLETANVTRFSADQRRGRAGRLGPGRCYRLWSAEDHRHLDVAAPPEVTAGDPLPIAFELSRWGDPDGNSLRMLDHPGAHRLAAGRSLLAGLGLVTEDGRLTERGRLAGRLGVHPRLGALLLTARERGQIALGATIAALLDDDRRPATTDLEAELDQRARQLRRTADRLSKRLPSTDRSPRHPNPGQAPARASRPGRRDPSREQTPAPAPRRSRGDVAGLLAAAWPDRVAIRRSGRDGSFLLANGREASLGRNDPMAGADFLIVAEADGEPRSATIRRAVATDRATVLEAIGDQVTWREHVSWDDRSGSVVSERRQRIGSIVLHREPLATPAPALIAEAVADGLRRRGLEVLKWSETALDIRDRLAWLNEEDPAEWPPVDDDSLLDRMTDWLDLSRCRTAADVARLGVGSRLLDLLDWQQRSSFETLAPAALALPSGERRRLDYSSGRPVWSVRLQQLLGLDRHPTVGPNDTAVTIELLSPANRPAQTTTDLPGFWRGTYAAVRADLRGRYPKHAWPERPWEAQPARRIR